MRPFYCSREDVKAALDNKTARDDSLIDRAIASASDGIEAEFHRKFYPQVDTRYFDWPNFSGARAGELWLDEDELLSIDTITSGGTTIAPADYFLYPSNSQPYNRLSLDRSANASFDSGSTAQRSIVIAGVFGYTDAEQAAGTLSGAVDASQTTVDVSDSSAVGVGHLIRVGTERLLVSGKQSLDSGQQLQGNLTANANAVTVPVEDGTGFHSGEVVLIDAERMLITDIAGNNLIVKRGWDGSVLAIHALNAPVYVPRRLTVERGSAGTTAATHGLSAPVFRHTPPSLIEELCLAEAINTVMQKQSGYARTIGTGESLREAPGRGISDIRKRAEVAYRRYRKAAV